MMHRIFIAINLPENIKKQLADYENNWPELPVRWTKEDDLHITLEFLGNLSDDELLRACQDTETFAKNHQPFTVTLDKITYGPPDKMPPRMIWATGPKIAELNLMPHITLGRIKAWAFRQIEPEERPEVAQEINLNFEVNSLEVVESQLKKSGPDYTILASCQLKK